jgi:hypothetical protein
MSSREVMIMTMGTIIGAAASAALVILAPLYILRDVLLLPFYIVVWIYRTVQYKKWLAEWIGRQNEETLRIMEEYIEGQIVLSNLNKYDETSLLNIYNIYNQNLRRNYVPDLFKQGSMQSQIVFNEQLEYFTFKIKKLKFNLI